ncbi:hypothetical protein PUW24_23290 [Paenibacillus urinalis]|uniref:Uncharacterized protein n=1 Tax=Paenibacillus urinalis TaxID=521520 RepID=A0AAX3MTM9_9BACL|nr:MULTISPECIES: hypothetical protein [Paenibacillus]WDH80976.1 hypothetical protein PUW23_15695 [Paenibacillus urinalis]WDH97028.1 hypothetical protein PUW24_23290 [Paenibacillus urinalis]WDI00690.1 hypothetical protein PUW25_15520 [Paenibacillus urinalis]GAK39362.1 hypothetical protein TCA2_1850 [Paenibacillus sp. TCA20]
MANKFFKFGVIKNEDVPEEVNEAAREVEKLPETIANEISEAFKDEKEDK